MVLFHKHKFAQMLHAGGVKRECTICGQFGPTFGQTPKDLAKVLIEHFNPRGFILEPGRGERNMYDLLPDPKDWCEIEEGRDFFDWEEKVDWIFANPPWDDLDTWLKHCFKVADKIMALIPCSHIWPEKMIEATRESEFGLKEIAWIYDPPHTWTSMEFGLAGVLWVRGYEGPVTVSYLSWK